MAGGWLKAIDFGCTQAVIQRPLARRTGTPVFMAPEVRAPCVTVCKRVLTTMLLKDVL